MVTRLYHQSLSLGGGSLIRSEQFLAIGIVFHGGPVIDESLDRDQFGQFGNASDVIGVEMRDHDKVNLFDAGDLRNHRDAARVPAVESDLAGVHQDRPPGVHHDEPVDGPLALVGPPQAGQVQPADLEAYSATPTIRRTNSAARYSDE